MPLDRTGYLLTAAIGVLVASGAYAAGGTTYNLCPPNPSLVPAETTPATGNPRTIRVWADHLEGKKNGITTLKGHVKITQGAKRFWANIIHFDQATQVMRGKGNLRYASPQFDLEARYGRYRFLPDHGTFFFTRYQIPNKHGHGRAKRVDTFTSAHQDLQSVTYSTCPIGQSPAWLLHAHRIHLNQKTQMGVAHNAWLDFKGVPLLWTPYISFPLGNQRKSGFLAPSFSYNGTNGLDLETPYYFNIAPNLDDTFTPRFISRRGFMGINTFRYLFPGTRGKLHIEYLPHDRLANRTRGLASFHDQTQLWTNWEMNTSLEYVSDPYYFDDLGSSLKQVTQTYQDRTVTFAYHIPQGSFVTLFQELAPLDPALTGSARPYRRLPEIALNLSWPMAQSNLTWSLSQEVTHFEAPGRQGAIRFNVLPTVSDTFGNGGYFLTPSFSFDETHYNLDPYAGSPSKTINRFAPIFSLDSGLIFERSLDAKGTIQQTLEPRAYYLYVPYRNQSQIPLFDTYQPPFSMSQLFSNNRFTGIDRLGDANQLSLALTSRFINTTTGQEFLTLSAGQIYYFRNRKVTLPGQPIQTQRRSDYVGEIRANFGDDLFASVDADYNPYQHNWDQGYVNFQYHPGTYQVFNVGYLYRQGELNATDISFSWPLYHHWSIIGKWDYSLLQHTTLETMAGLQYNSCCWQFRIVQRRFVTFTGQGNSALYIELHLKGLGSLGNRLEDFLQNDIMGYGKNPNE